MRRHKVLAAKISNACIAAAFSAGYIVLNPLDASLASNSFLWKDLSEKKDKTQEFFIESKLYSSRLSPKYYKDIDKNPRIVEIAKDNLTKFKSHSEFDGSISLDKGNIQKPNEIPDKLIPINIQAERQYWESGNIFIAEGNVTASLNNGHLRAEKIIFDQENNIILAENKVIFKRGSQYFSASYFKYDLQNGIGEIRNVYGVISVNLLSNDLNLSSSENLNLEKENNRYSFLELRDSVLIEGGKFNKGMNPFVIGDLPFKGINSWRFNSSNIVINKSGWKARKITFSNDPLNPVQTKIPSKNVVATENDDGVLIISASSSKLILEDKLTIPLGKRTFGKRDRTKQKWVVGYDSKDRDGFYLGRKIKPIKLSESYKLSIQPQFLIQRAINGKTNSYISSGESVVGPTISRPSKLSDLFGLKAKLKGREFNKDIEFSANITTFNASSFADGSRFSATIRDTISIGDIKDIETTLFSAYRYKSWNGSLGQSDIYTSYGGYIDKGWAWKNGKIDYSYRLRTGLGKYQAEALDRLELENLWRASIFNTFSISNPIYSFSTNSNNGALPYSKYSTAPIKPGLVFNTAFTSNYFYYEDNSSQSSFGISAGPELTFGSFRRPILDYTKLAISSGYIVKSGDSPFKFDNLVDLQNISFTMTQQIYGPLLLSGLYDINIDKGSDYYGESISSRIALLWERRAYAFGVFYDIKNELGGVMFRLNGFGFDGSDVPMGSSS